MRKIKKIICLVGPSGVGKTSHTKKLVAKYDFILPMVVTTRQKRPDDERNYLYTTEPNFLNLVNSNSFLEWDKYSNYYYGTLLQSIDTYQNLTNCCGILLDLTPKGCRKIIDVFPFAIIIALLPDDPTWLFERLKNRGLQSPEEVQLRTNLLKDYIEEINLLNCKKVSVNFSPSSWDKTFKDIEQIIFENEDA